MLQGITTVTDTRCINISLRIFEQQFSAYETVLGVRRLTLRIENTNPETQPHRQ